MQAHIERCTPSSHHEESFDASLDVVMTMLRSFGDEWCALIHLERSETETLFLAASNGRYAVTMQRGGDFFDLVGDEHAEGAVEFVHGCQPDQWPRRLLVPLDLALSAARSFFDGTYDGTGLRWE